MARGATKGTLSKVDKKKLLPKMSGKLLRDLAIVSKKQKTGRRKKTLPNFSQKITFGVLKEL